MDDLEMTRRTLETVENITIPIISGIGLLANAVVILVISIWERYRANRTVANLFAVNLAVADFLFLVILPLHIPAVKFAPVLNNGVCKLIEVVKFVNYRASVLFLTMMSIDRYLAIVYTLKSRAYRSRNISLKICIVLWVLSIACAVPAGVYAGIDNVDSQCKLMFPGFKSDAVDIDTFYDDFNFTFDYYSADGSGVIPDKFCQFEEHTNSISYQAWIYTNFVMFFVLPVAIILGSYAAIIKATVSRQIQSQHRVTIMVAVLVIAFVACWLPQQVANADLCNKLLIAFAVLAWSNSALNPILYSISSQRFRSKAIKCAKYLRYGYQRSMLMEQQTLQTKLATLRQRHTSQQSGPIEKMQAQENYNPTFEQETPAKL